MRLNAQGPARLENSRGLQRICLLPWPTLPYHFMGPPRIIYFRGLAIICLGAPTILRVGISIPLYSRASP